MEAIDFLSKSSISGIEKSLVGMVNEWEVK